MTNISLNCKKNIDNINKLVDTAVSEIKKANDRANNAEKTLELIKKQVKTDLVNAYQEGYKLGINSINETTDGGTSRSEENTKLVLKND